MSIIATFPWGWIGTIGDNEIEIVSTMPDPPKVRLAVETDKVESNLGAISFNLRRPNGTHDEYGVVMGRLTADKQGGAIYVALSPDGDQGVREVLYVDNAQAIFRVPIVAPNLGASGRVTRFYTDGGKFCVNMQDDQNNVRAVKYLIVPTAQHPNIVTSDESTWQSVGAAVL